MAQKSNNALIVDSEAPDLVASIPATQGAEAPEAKTEEPKEETNLEESTEAK